MKVHGVNPIRQTTESRRQKSPARTMNNGAEFGQAAYWAVDEATSAAAGKGRGRGVVGG